MTKKRMYVLLLQVLTLLGCNNKSTDTGWKISEDEYLETPGFNVLVFHNYYPEGNQGGIEFIHHEERIATNGYITVDLPGGRFPRPERAVRTTSAENKEITASIKVPEFNFNYSLRVWPVGNSFRIALDLETPIPAEWEGKVNFDLELYPVAYHGKTYQLGQQFGVFPEEGLGPMTLAGNGQLDYVPMAEGPDLLIAAEDPLRKIRIVQANGNISLLDGRNTSLGGWIIIRSEVPKGTTRGAVEWTVTPNLIPDWVRDPVISISQAGYHPDQVKRAIIELDAREDKVVDAVLQKIGTDGEVREAASGMPADWGKFLRYKYLIYDFTTMKDPGIYRVKYGETISEPFRISGDVFQKSIWQPTLEIYFPVQMCHMRVRDRGRVWHGACHLDDAVQAPVSTEHVDGYRTYSTTETNFTPFTTVPYLNRGGWHDAGDNDLAAGSQAQTTLFLALAGEAFGIDVDQTTVQQDALMVHLRRPDGIPDLQQQIEHGVINLLSGYRASGHSFVGIIETREGRAFLGDVASVSDQLYYDRSLKPGEIRGNRSGKPDDRWIVTNKDTSLEYEVITALAAASRLLRGYNDALAEECLLIAIRAWEYEQSHEPVIQPNAYVPRHHEWQEVHATAELLITTKEGRFRDRLIALLPVIKESPGEVGWSAARALSLVDDETFKNGVREALQTYKAELDSSLAATPFGVPWRPRIWGIGWDIQDYAVAQYYLNRAFPDLFDRENVLRVVNFVLGCHPGSSTSFVSAVGARSLMVAYGFNMHWWSYIPGGMASGTALIRPDFPELKEPYPYLWQQTEYVMPGAATYIFSVLAADKLLN
ncbi:MAG TPA: glycoside hydrolase family 9 protein [Cyclobacteriaceae bacterium]|nr:glycoside hydrolase family 9 protein [Cyclobacteriaceae bacterium]